MKRRKVESASSSVDIPSVSNSQLQAEIFKLKMDHFEQLFDWLSLKDVVTLSETCKRMQHIVGYYMKTNYVAMTPQFSNGSIEVRQFITNHKIKLDGLSSSLKRCEFFGENDFDCDDEAFAESELPKMLPKMETEQFESLTEIAISHGVFTNDEISRFKEISGQLETVRLQYPRFLNGNKEFYDSFLQYCTNIKKLCIEVLECTPIVGTDNSWLLRKYPTLEHLELMIHDYEPIEELKTFFEPNTNLSSFAAGIELIQQNEDTLKNTPAKLDILSVEFKDMESLNSTLDLLNELYDRGLFKQLFAYFPITPVNSPLDQETANQLNSVKGLTKLYVMATDQADLSHLINLKQLCVHDPSETRMDAERFVNLESIEFTSTQWNDILPFIRHSPKLNKVFLFYLTKFDEILNLSIEQLNKERSKLPDAKKVIIYVVEHVYLAVKWAKNQTEWSLIEIKRASSYNGLYHDFNRINESYDHRVI